MLLIKKTKISQNDKGKTIHKKGISYLGRKQKDKTKNKKRQEGKGFPISLLETAAVPLLGEIAKPLFKTIFGRGRRKRRSEKKYCWYEG